MLNKYLEQATDGDTIWFVALGGNFRTGGAASSSGKDGKDGKETRGFQKKFQNEPEKDRTNQSKKLNLLKKSQLRKRNNEKTAMYKREAERAKTDEKEQEVAIQGRIKKCNLSFNGSYSSMDKDVSHASHVNQGDGIDVATAEEGLPFVDETSKRCKT